MNDLISRQMVVDAIKNSYDRQKESYIDIISSYYIFTNGRNSGLFIAESLPSAQPEPHNCNGCKHNGMWENELEYGYNCPCIKCIRIARDYYE